MNNPINTKKLTDNKEKTYSGEELWNIAATLFHNPDCSKRYIQYLVDIIQDKNARILDTACGTGFPSIDLYQAGFKNIVGFDGSADAIKLFRERFDKIPLTVGSWQNIDEIIKDQFYVLLNVDNSLPYMDSWQKESQMADNEEEINRRVINILKKFYTLLKPNGKLIIAIAKNNDKSFGSATQFNLGNGIYDSKQVSAVWNITYDWEHKIKTFDNEVIIDGKTYHMIGRSYLITKEETGDLLTKAGFSRTEIVETDNLYDNFIVGYK